MVKRLLVLAVVAAAVAVPVAGSADPVTDPSMCFNRGHATFAKFIRPQGGMLQAQTTPTGTLTLQSGGPVPAVFLSTTGVIDVEVEHACMRSLSLRVFKNGNPAPVYSSDWISECQHTTRVEQVAIGLDGGSYEFQVTGAACNGAPVRGDGQGGVVGDPPIL